MIENQDGEDKISGKRIKMDNTKLRKQNRK